MQKESQYKEDVLKYVAGQNLVRDEYYEVDLKGIKLNVRVIGPPGAGKSALISTIQVTVAGKLKEEDFSRVAFPGFEDQNTLEDENVPILSFKFIDSEGTNELKADKINFDSVHDIIVVWNITRTVDVLLKKLILVSRAKKINPIVVLSPLDKVTNKNVAKIIEDVRKIGARAVIPISLYSGSTKVLIDDTNSKVWQLLYSCMARDFAIGSLLPKKKIEENTKKQAELQAQEIQYQSTLSEIRKAELSKQAEASNAERDLYDAKIFEKIFRVFQPPEKQKIEK